MENAAITDDPPRAPGTSIVHDYIRRCPACGTENPPQAVVCTCGMLLAGVDFTLRQGDNEIFSPQVVQQPDLADAPADAPATAASDEDTVPPPAVAQQSPPAPSAAATPVCPAADCGQPNPAGVQRCVYCNHVLNAAPAAPAPVHADAALPLGLATQYRIVREINTSSPESGLFVVAPLVLLDALKAHSKRAARIYRRGFRPDAQLLEKLDSFSPFVVKTFAHGLDDDIAWELMEYFPKGSVRDMLDDEPLPAAALQRLIAGVCAALTALHAQGIVHRDLKPENLLVRKRKPLIVALGDFGAASVGNGVRTPAYAAPETLTGMIDARSDWWSLGMILLEAATGHHPFEGLSAQTIRFHLATRPVEISGIGDARLAQLCRGLLQRDPLQRWGSEEVQRWLENDASLPLLQETAEQASAKPPAAPYRIGKYEAHTAAELAVALAGNWKQAREDMSRGILRNWVADELKDVDLTRRLLDIAAARHDSPDRRLLRFLLAAAPDLPPLWQGVPADREALLARARQAMGQDENAQRARRWLDSLLKDEVLRLYGFCGHADLVEMDHAWRAGIEHSSQLWQDATEKREQWQLKQEAASTGHINVDRVIYGQTRQPHISATPTWLASLLLAQNDARYASALRQDAAEHARLLGGDVAWLGDLMDTLPQDDPLAPLVLHHLLPLAATDADQQKLRQKAAQEKQVQQFRQHLEKAALAVHFFGVPWPVLTLLTTTTLQEGADHLHDALTEAERMAPALPHPGDAQLLEDLRSFQRQVRSLSRPLDDLRRMLETNALLSARLWGILGALLVTTTLFGARWVLRYFLVIVLIASLPVAAFALHRWRLLSSTRHAMQRRLRHLRTQAQSILRKVERMQRQG